MGGERSIKVKVEFDVDKALHKAQLEKAQILLKNEVAKGSDKYVPFLNGVLAKSVNASINTPDPMLIYNAPYARYQYYGVAMAGRPPKHVKTPKKKGDKVELTYTKTHHPQACAQWFEKWKGAEGDATVKKVQDFVRQNFKG